MNGIEKITGLIQSEAQAEIDAVLSQAREESARIAARYETQVKAETTEMDGRSERAAAEREERLVSAAQMEARKAALAAKQEMVEKAYALALEKLCAMPEAQYTEVLATLLVRASSTGREEVILSEKDRKEVGQAAVAKANKDGGKQLTLSKETLSIPGGFILKDQNVEVNCTFDTLVRLQKAETAGMVAKKLFPEA